MQHLVEISQEAKGVWKTLCSCGFTSTHTTERQADRDAIDHIRAEAVKEDPRLG